jgi:hypothetical protein
VNISRQLKSCHCREIDSANDHRAGRRAVNIGSYEAVIR